MEPPTRVHVDAPTTAIKISHFGGAVCILCTLVPAPTELPPHTDRLPHERHPPPTPHLSRAPGGMMNSLLFAIRINRSNLLVVRFLGKCEIGTAPVTYAVISCKQLTGRFSFPSIIFFLFVDLNPNNTILCKYQIYH
ncbi:hypothetical protein GWI33_006140 [Rhynchophorus ferrugineus]|uniref:Uncharacterized protein n=1 Tax=Rhynchophorus ferrugineus TaxID=354439 RepID=A0A834IKY5_RHYFE|nr:hypothetical protein GWI33_006140 [Rhynchophorus ferrugineus]